MGLNRATVVGLRAAYQRAISTGGRKLDNLQLLPQTTTDGTDPRAMAKLATVAKVVRRHWLSHGLRVTSVTPTEMAGLRQLQPDGKWEEYETFLRIAGLPHDEDREGVRFWLPREVRLSRDVLADAGYGCNAVEPSVIVADYLQESYWYGLWLAGPFAGCVSLVLGTADGNDPQPPMGSFVDFLFAYLDDDTRMYPP